MNEKLKRFMGIVEEEGTDTIILMVQVLMK